MDDIKFLHECGVQPDPLWLLEQSATTPEQKQYVSSLLRINMMLGGSLRINLE